MNSPVTNDGSDILTTLYTKLQQLTIDNENVRNAILTFQNDHAIANNLYNGFEQSSMGGVIPTTENLSKNKNILILELGNRLREYGYIQDQLISMLKLWQQQQALAGNGATLINNLDGIQYCAETLMDRITEIIIFVNNLQQLGEDSTLNEILRHAQTLQNLLLYSTFIVEKQPPQVIKKSSKFPATIRWLIGDKMGIHLSKPKIYCEILSEVQAKRLTTENLNIPPTTNGEVTGNEATMEYNSNNRHFSASFTNLAVKTIVRSERKGPVIVTDEKCTLLFYASIIHNNYVMKLWTFTLPVVMVVHGIQEPQSWATITWDNAFSVIDREPFQVTDKVHYSNLLDALNMKFKYTTGRALTTENLEFLREKLIFTEDGTTNEYITFSQFCRDKMPGRGFTFWEWFYGIMKLTKEHLKQSWCDGQIVGFINKRKTLEGILPFQSNGTFLLRFSDSEIGGITIAFRDFYNNIMILAPWTSNDLQTLSLADRIRDLDVLKIVYPKMMPRDAVFGPAPIKKTGRSDYVSSVLKVHIAPQPTSTSQM
uniref:Signal transducer and transcription activator n=1 Tax=Ceratitis capitata TaxID=7213 RepID=W8BS26_CERCA